MLSSIKHCGFPVTLMPFLWKRANDDYLIFLICFYVKKCPHIVLTGRFTQKDCHSRTLSSCYSAFFLNPPMSLLQFGRLQTEITNHKLELCLIVRMILLIVHLYITLLCMHSSQIFPKPKHSYRVKGLYIFSFKIYIFYFARQLFFQLSYFSTLILCLKL